MDKAGGSAGLSTPLLDTASGAASDAAEHGHESEYRAVLPNQQDKQQEFVDNVVITSCVMQPDACALCVAAAVLVRRSAACAVFDLALLYTTPPPPRTGTTQQQHLCQCSSSSSSRGLPMPCVHSCAVRQALLVVD